MLTDSTRKYLCRVVGLYDKNTIMSFTTVPCLIPENIYGRLASYFTVKSTDILQCTIYRFVNRDRLNSTQIATTKNHINVKNHESEPDVDISSMVFC